MGFQSAYAQQLNVGVIAGASLTDDFRPTTFTPSLGGASYHISNASDWFMVGPKIELKLPKDFAMEFDAIRRKIRSRSITTFPEPLELPNGVTIRALEPTIGDAFTWEFSTLGKYRVGSRTVRPLVEFGASFLPLENRDQTGITVGSGIELPIWRLSASPTLRYTRWVTSVSQGAAVDQFHFVVGIHETSDSVRPQAFGRPLSLGVVAGFGLTKLLRDGEDFVFQSAFTSDSHPPVGGMMIGIRLRNRLALEIDALYRPTHIIDTERTAFLTWQVPVLATYKMSASKIAPLIELGPSFRAIAHANSDEHSHYGISGGAGVVTRLRSLTVAPVIRYTRWAADKDRRGLEPYTAIRPSQVELVLGFSF
jgi:hypothetical protein